jgi:hypothetical protein
MIISASRRLIQKFFVLGLLLSCLGLMSAGAGTKASASAPNTNNTLRPCCSACEADPTIPICRYGCTEGC